MRRRSCRCSSITSNGRPPRSIERRRDRGARFDRALERCAVVGAGSDVEHDEHGRAPPRFVLAHHQVPAPCRRTPVDVAQVVSGRVVAQGVEVAARLDAGTHLRMVTVEVEAAGLGRRQQVTDARDRR